MMKPSVNIISVSPAQLSDGSMQAMARVFYSKKIAQESYMKRFVISTANDLRSSHPS
jgi:hypothetical protein